MDVDEAPDAELLYMTELVAIHDPIELLNSDDSETDSGQRWRSCPRGTYHVQPVAGLTTRQFEINVLQCTERNFLEL